MKKPSMGRQARRSGQKQLQAIPYATPEYLAAYVNQERRAGRLFTQADVLDLLNDNAQTCIRIVFTALMEGHICGSARILRDLDPLVNRMFDDMERLTREDGADVAHDKLAERYQKAKRNSFRSVKGLEHLTGGKNETEDD